MACTSERKTALCRQESLIRGQFTSLHFVLESDAQHLLSFLYTFTCTEQTSPCERKIQHKNPSRALPRPRASRTRAHASAYRGGRGSGRCATPTLAAKMFWVYSLNHQPNPNRLASRPPAGSPPYARADESTPKRQTKAPDRPKIQTLRLSYGLLSRSNPILARLCQLTHSNYAKATSDIAS